MNTFLYNIYDLGDTKVYYKREFKGIEEKIRIKLDRYTII